MSTKLVIIGATAFGEIKCLIDDLNRAADNDANYEVVGILDDNDALRNTTMCGVPVIGGTDKARELPADIRFVFCVGSYKTRLIRHALLQKIGVSHARYVTLVHPTARIYNASMVGFGCIIHPNVVVYHNTTIDDFVVISPNCVIGANNRVMEGALVASLVSTTTNVHLGPYCHIGTGALIAEGKKVGAGAQVGMGTHVFRDVPNGAFCLGNPPRILSIEEIPSAIIDIVH